MSVFDSIRNDRDIPLRFVDRPGGASTRPGPASFLERFFDRVTGGGAELDTSGGDMTPGFRGVPDGDNISGIPSAGSILARQGAPGSVSPSGNDIPVDIPDDQRLELFDAIRERNEIIGEGIKASEALDEFERERGADLTPQQKQELDAMREEMAKNIKLAEAEETALLREQFQSGQLGKRMQEELFGDEPLIPGADPETIQILNRALGRTQFGEGVGQNELLTIMDEIVNSNLPADEKEERLDFIAARTSMRDELQLTLNNVIEDRRGLERIAAMSDLELLGNEAEFQNTMLNFELGPDPTLQTRIGVSTMLDEGYEELTGKEIPPSVEPMIQNGETGLIDDLIANPDLINTTGFQQRVADVAQILDIKHSDLLGMIQEGMEYGNLRIELWDNALNKNQFTPQSEEFAMAIFQAALGELGNEQLAAQFAESKDLHMIIAGQSGAMVGRDIGDGSKHGIGGLTDEGYEFVGVDYEDIRGDTAEELAALVRYIVARYGDPVEAINAYKRTGTWGD